MRNKANDNPGGLHYNRTCTSSLYTSTYSQLQPEFGTSRLVCTLGLSLFVAGLGTGPMILSPLSEVRHVCVCVCVCCLPVWLQETRSISCESRLTYRRQFYGRRPIYIGSFSFFLIWMIPCALARNIQTMLVARFLDGLAGSAFLSVAGGTVGDMFAKHVSCHLSLPFFFFCTRKRYLSWLF